MPQQLRIIGGQWRGRKLPVPDRPGLRPSPDRVRETLFNWLGQDLQGWRCIDVFAGTGALGLEAASRGAAQVLLAERDTVLAGNLRALKEKLGAEAVQVRQGDGLALLGDCAPASLDLVLLDPPFEEAALFAPALHAAVRAVQARGFVYLEAPRAWGEAALAATGLALHRHLAAGAVHAHLLVPTGAGSA